MTPRKPSTEPSFAGQRDPRALLLVGLPAAFAVDIADQARAAGYTSRSIGASDVPSLGGTLTPAIVMANLDMTEGLSVLSTLRRLLGDVEIAAVTSTPCVVRVAEAVRRGASTVVARPGTFSQVRAALGHRVVPPLAADHMSFDRVMWEFLNQAILEAGSISGAARHLRLDRTSLKRKLRKVPPL